MSPASYRTAPPRRPMLATPNPERQAHRRVPPQGGARARGPRREEGRPPAPGKAVSLQPGTAAPAGHVPHRSPPLGGGWPSRRALRQRPRRRRHPDRSADRPGGCGRRRVPPRSPDRPSPRAGHPGPAQGLRRARCARSHQPRVGGDPSPVALAGDLVGARRRGRIPRLGRQEHPSLRKAQPDGLGVADAVGDGVGVAEGDGDGEPVPLLAANCSARRMAACAASTSAWYFARSPALSAASAAAKWSRACFRSCAICRWTFPPGVGPPPPPSGGTTCAPNESFSASVSVLPSPTSPPFVTRTRFSSGMAASWVDRTYTGWTYRRPFATGMIRKSPNLTSEPLWPNRVWSAENLGSWRIRANTCDGPSTFWPGGNSYATILP